jgi:hypothetical protein
MVWGYSSLEIGAIADAYVSCTYGVTVPAV